MSAWRVDEKRSKTMPSREMKSLLRASNIGTEKTCEQLLQRAMWQMTAYLDVVCKRVFQEENAMEVLQKREKDVSELISMLEY